MRAFARVKANEPPSVTPPHADPKRGGLLVVGYLLAAALVPAGTAAAQDAFQEAVRAGNTAWTGRNFPVAQAAYLRALSLDSVGSSQVVYRAAVLYSWDGDLLRAIPLFSRYTRLEPRDDEGRIALAKAYAWHGETAVAVAVYDSILGRDRTYRDAALGAAQTLAWAGRFAEAIGRYERWIEENGKDVEASLARARTMAWAGHLKQSEREYQRLSEGGERLEASKGAALVAGWRGDLFRSEGMWRGITARFPLDAEAWVGLAQVLRWSGRPEDARDALVKAVASDPDNADARNQRRWVAADLAPGVLPGAASSWDSDGNTSTLVSLRGNLRPVRRTNLTVTASHRWAHFGVATGTSAGARASLRWSPERRVTLTGDLGLVSMHGERGTEVVNRSQMIGAGSASVRLSSRASIGANLSRDVFDETASLILAGIVVSTVGVEGEIDLGRGVSLSGGAHRADFSGGSVVNQRQAVFGALRWRPKRGWSVTAGGRSLGYDASPRDGYFSPARYRHGEVATRWAPGRDLGWGGFVEAGVGAQYVRFVDPGSTKATQRIGAGLSYRPAPGTEFSASYGFSNVSSAGSLASASGSVYHASVVSLSARIRL